MPPVTVAVIPPLHPEVGFIVFVVINKVEFAQGLLLVVSVVDVIEKFELELQPFASVTVRV